MLDTHAHRKPYAALASVCFFWGTTYLGIRIALESFAPVRLVAIRFLIAGLLMVTLVRWRGLALPRGRELMWTSLNGFLILGIGNLCLTLSERLIPSSLAALFIAASPFWFVGLESVVPGGDKIRPAALLGIVMGFVGAALLFAPNLVEHGFEGRVWQGFLILQAGSISWSLGSILQKRQPTGAHPFAAAAVQQLTVGVVYAAPAMLTPSRASETSWSGIASVTYLVIFGSLVGYSSYVYALEKLPVALVSLYTYVNPLVAAVLGWIAYREPFGLRETMAMAIIFAGVAVVKKSTPPRSRA